MRHSSPSCPRSTRAAFEQSPWRCRRCSGERGDALPDARHVIELEIDGEHIQIVLDARPSVTAGPSTDADARIRVPRPTMSDFLLGRSFDEKRFAHISGNKAARTALIRALGAESLPLNLDALRADRVQSRGRL